MEVFFSRNLSVYPWGIFIIWLDFSPDQSKRKIPENFSCPNFHVQHTYGKQQEFGLFSTVLWNCNNILQFWFRFRLRFWSGQYLAKFSILYKILTFQCWKQNYFPESWSRFSLFFIYFLFHVMLDSDSIPFPLWQKVTVGPVPQHCFTYKKMRAQRRLVIQGRAPHYQHRAMRVYKLIRMRAKSLLGECETVFMRSGVADPGFLSEFFHPGSRIKKGTGSRIRRKVWK